MKIDNGRSSPRELRDIANSEEPQRKALEAARAIQKDARRLAPRRTGNLRKHIGVEKILVTETGVEGYAVGWEDEAFYGPFVENGDENSAPRPHLVPAAIKNGATGDGGDA